MLGNEDRYDDIDRYVTGQMSSQEREEFLAEVSQDASLKAQVHLVEDIRDGLVRRNEKLEKIHSWESSRQNKAVAAKNVIKWSSLCAAAAVAIGVFISYPTSYMGLQDREFISQADFKVRGDSTLVLNDYWKAEGYEACLLAIHDESESWRQELSALEHAVMTDEEREFKVREAYSKLDYLAWAEIQTLLKARRYDEALTAVDAYIEAEGTRLEKALKLQKRLKRKLNR